MEPAQERTVLHSIKLEGVEDLKSTLTSDMEMQNLEFALHVFCLAFVQYFLTMTFWNGNIYSMLLELCDLLFPF